MINITAAAAKQILISGSSEPEGSALRVAAKRGPDGSIQYGMGFDGEREGDFLFDSHGVTFVVAPTSAPFLEGTTLDFVEMQPGDFQFIFFNPQDAAAPGAQEQSSGNSAAS